MKTLIGAILIVSLAFQSIPDENLSGEGANNPTLTDSLDILPEVLAINSNPAMRLSGDFRKGSVSNYEYTDYLKKTDFGYTIKLPANNNAPTPTWFDGKIYVSGGFGSRQYYSFYAETGELNWAVNLDDDGPSSAVIDDGVIVYNSESCTIFACDVTTGKEIWSYFLGDPLVSTPTIDNGIVFSSYPCGIGTVTNYNVINNNNDADNVKLNDSISAFPQTASLYDHALIAFDLHSGKILWQKRIAGDVLTAPIAENNELHVVTFSGAYYVMDEQTGEFKSAHRIRATSAPVFSDGTVFFSRRADKAGEDVSEVVTGLNYAQNTINYQSTVKKATYLDAKVQSDSKLKSESMNSDAGNGFGGGAPESSGYKQAMDNIGQSNVSSLQNFYGSRVLNDKNRNYTMMGDTLVCTNIETGKDLWKFAVEGDLKKEGGYLATSPVVAGNYLITATLNGDILLFDKGSGKLMNTYTLKEPIRSQPIAMNGWIYVTTTAGTLAAINTGDSTITGWSMLGGDVRHSNKVQ